MAGEVRIRSVRGRSNVPGHRPSVHGYRRRPAGFLRSEGRRLGYARLLAAARDGAADRWRNFALEESSHSLARSDRARSRWDESENSGDATPGRAAPMAG